MSEFIQAPCYTQGRQGQTIDHIIIHWMDGDLASCDQVFRSGSRQTSNHYGIEDTIIHQYVAETDTAWGCGNWNMNLRSIGIEHSAQPGRDATMTTLETSARLISAIAKRWNIPIDRSHIIRHSEVVPTQCPGTVDIDRLIARAAEVAANADIALISVPVPQVQPEPASLPITPWSGQVTVTQDLIVRAQPTSNSAGEQGNTQDGDVHNGDVIDIAGWLHAQDPYGDGRDVWLETTNGHFVWAAGTTFNSGTPAAPVAQNGTVTITVPELEVRTGPSTSYPSGAANTPDGALHQGNVVQYTGVVTGESINGNDKWLRSVRGNYFWAGGTNL